MTIIKKIIAWIIELLRSIFGKKKSKKTTTSKENNNLNSSITKLNGTNSFDHDSMPAYVICDSDGKLILINNIDSLKSKLFDDISAYKKEEIDRLIKILNKDDNYVKEDINNIYSLFNKDISRLRKSELDELISKYNIDSRQEFLNTYERISEKEQIFSVFNRDLEAISDAIDEEKISFITRDFLNEQEEQLLKKKNLFDQTDDLKGFKEKFYDVIKNYDDAFIKEIRNDYKKVNYVTMSNLIIDKSIKRFHELENDFKMHRFNVSYYEREINKIKNQINALKEIKNKKVVQEELDRLKKELYTKSKDKYDVLYNNEVFANIDKQCDDLLKSINTKVIDIKKEEKETKKAKEIKEQKEIENIILRFKDMELARKYIMQSLEIEGKEIKLDANSLLDYTNRIYDKYHEGINGDFNFKKNNDRTELVILYNDLNRAIANVRIEEFMPIEHINFRMDDLVEAVIYRKNEWDVYLNRAYNHINDEDLVSEKLNNIKTSKNSQAKIKNKTDDLKNNK